MTQPTVMRGSVPFPHADAAAVAALAVGFARIAGLVDGIDDDYRAAASSVAGRTDGWSGDAATAFERAVQRRAADSQRCTSACRIAARAVDAHADATRAAAVRYEANARAERHLRTHSPDARAAIDQTIRGQVDAVMALQNSATAAVAAVRQATKRLLPAVNRLSAERSQHLRPASDDRWTSGGLDSLARRFPDHPMVQIDNGTLHPDPTTRLGAYAATAGYPPGTVGDAVHRAIGTIYLSLGTAGEEQIGTVFNSAEARALFDEPLTRENSRRIADIEHRYWSQVRRDNPWSFGGNAGSVFSPGIRDQLQRHVFGEADAVPAPTSR